ncbi:unnamed protein product [Adineta ricciae]|uniref:Cation efflux protein cytoplasmic domain-containing protein n=1 Tax=Adineta ricciae TaxID=249248 RepID=A0A815V7V4_ADIRI|nr:unnamed protein product [Adineta ricciae]CAF1524482.1 unnamed protein product [Adineta ricciae]
MALEAQAGQTFPVMQINPESTETVVLLPRTNSTTLHRRSVERTECEKDAEHETPPAYSMEEITARRRGKRAEDQNLPKKVRSFYKKQDKLISTFERVHRLHSDKHSDNEDDEDEDEDHGDKSNKKDKQDVIIRRKRISFYTKLSLLVNICLLAMKIAAAILSRSLSVISSVVDSGVDLTTSVILFWATHAMNRPDRVLYPIGRRRLEPISIVILSVIMSSASVMVISESLQTIAQDVDAFRGNLSETSKNLHELDMRIIPISIMCTTIVSKLVLFILCSRESSVTLNALAQDHRNDVFSNVIALICGVAGSHARLLVGNWKQYFILADPIGAVVVSIYILVTWVRQASQQVKRLTGHTAKPEFLQQITWVAFHHSPQILKIDTVRAFHFGTNFLVEVDIVLPEDMSLRDAHDIGEALQKKIERIPEVERAFVHLDYEFSHKAQDEHKVV